MVKSIILCVFLISRCSFLISQPTVQSCEDFGLNTQMVDTDGDGVLDSDIFFLYKDSTTQVIPDCWVFSHPGDTHGHHIVYPGPWTENPSGQRKEAIDATREALVRSRVLYDRFGDTERDWLFLLSGHTENDTAYTYNANGECWMRSNVYPDSDGSGTLNEHKQMVAHEAAHCFQIENLGPRYHYWLDESNAEFMSAIVYPRTNSEHWSAVEFDLDGSSFKQEYNANAILEEYSNVNGQDQTMELIKNSFFQRSSGLTRYYKDHGFDQFLHNFYYLHFQGGVADHGGGFVPREEDVDPAAQFELFPGVQPPIDLPDLESERLTEINLIVPQEYDLLIEPPIHSSVEAHYSIIADNTKIKIWNNIETIKGYCDSDLKVTILSSHLNHVSVTGGQIQYELKEREGCCSTSSSLGTIGSSGSPVVSANPSELDKQFHFDYAIESDIRMNSDGETMTLEGDYFVNSKDGSMLFFDEFLIMNFDKSSNNQYDFHAAIWMPNGQMVAYVYDKRTDTNRAITIATDQTRQDVVRSRSNRVIEFLRESRSSSLSPAPLPSGSRWVNQSTGHAAKQADFPGSPDMNKVSIYFSNDMTSISSPMKAFGFMVGYAKDHQRRNKLLVYHKTELSDGSTMEAELHSILKDCRTFSGHSYEPMTLIGDQGRIGSMSQADRDDLVVRQQAYQAEFMRLMNRLNDCGDNSACIANIERQMLELQQQRAESIRNLPGNPNYSGSEGTEHENEEMAITNQMHVLQAQAIDKKLECAQKADRLELCVSGGGGAGCTPLFNAWEACKDELEAMRVDMERLQCELAKLKGMEDMMEDCY